MWKQTEGSQRGLWRALAQLCVGITHTQRGNPAGTYCVEATGMRSPLVAQLKFSRLPCVYVLDEKGAHRRLRWPRKA